MMTALIIAMIVVTALNLCVFVSSIVLIVGMKKAAKRTTYTRGSPDLIPDAIYMKLDKELPTFEETSGIAKAMEKSRNDLADWFEKKERKEVLAHFLKFRKPVLEKLHEALHEAIAEAQKMTTTLAYLHQWKCPACGSPTIKERDSCDYHILDMVRATCNGCGKVYETSLSFGSLFDNPYDAPIIFKEVPGCPEETQTRGECRPRATPCG